MRSLRLAEGDGFAPAATAEAGHGPRRLAVARAHASMPAAAARTARPVATPPGARSRDEAADRSAPGPAAASQATGLALHDRGCLCGQRRLFGGLTLHVPPGHLLRVQGDNGAGKTSLLRVICGLLPPTQGRVCWQGRSIAELRDEFGRQLVYLGHAAALKVELSPLENLVSAAVLAGQSPQPADAAAALARAGLAGAEHAPVRILSQGQRRRVALARLELARAVPLWVLDEPFNALDMGATAWLAGLVADHVQAGGIVVLTSHQRVGLRSTVEQLTVTL